jgi:hypothetical protein
MSGPPPKPASQRRRRNKAQAVVKLPSEPSKRTVPALPDSGKLLKSTREWWRTVWSSPMAAVWLEADMPALARLAKLVDEAARGEVAGQVLVEVRQLEDRFGLSPLARRRLQWGVDQAGGEASDDAPEADKDGRWLRVVSD